jgi:hypothetical protein
LAALAGVDGSPGARNEAVRASAATALLDRGWGRPIQMVAGDANQLLTVDFRWASDPPAAAAPVIDGQVLQPVWQQIEAQDDNERVQQRGHATERSPKCGEDQ